MKKLTLHSEIVYFVAIALLALSVAMLTSAGYGLSMLVAPAYLLSLKIGITFGEAEYIIQAILFVLFCLITRRFKLAYLSSFVTCLIYGVILDLWQRIPIFNPAIYPSESFDTWARILMFILGTLLTCFSVALFFKSYLYPQVYDFFVKGICERFHAKNLVVKTIFDFSLLAIGTTMTLLIFGEFKGIYWGTLAMAVCCGTFIGFFGKLLDKIIAVKPIFPRFAVYFELEDKTLEIPHDAYVREAE